MLLSTFGPESGGQPSEPRGRWSPLASRDWDATDQLPAYFGPNGRSKTVGVEGAFRSKWKGCFGDVALPFRHMWHDLR